MRQETKRKMPFQFKLVLSVAIAAGIALLLYFFVSIQIVTSDSMSPAYQEGDTIFVLKNTEIEEGDVVAFYYGNKILVRRVIGTQGNIIDIDENGTVSVDNEVLDEPYVSQLALGDGDTEFPYQVPANRYFLLGDNRELAPDSRTSAIGCISEDQLIGKVLFRIWPLGSN